MKESNERIQWSNNLMALLQSNKKWKKCLPNLGMFDIIDDIDGDVITECAFICNMKNSLIKNMNDLLSNLHF